MRSELVRTESEVQRAWNMLANREDLGWLRDALALKPSQHTSYEAQARYIESLRDRSTLSWIDLERRGHNSRLWSVP